MGKTVGVALPRGLVISLSTGSPIGCLFCCLHYSSTHGRCGFALLAGFDFAAYCELEALTPLYQSKGDGSMFSQATLSPVPVGEVCSW
jgi:hypothetical protein